MAAYRPGVGQNGRCVSPLISPMRNLKQHGHPRPDTPGGVLGTIHESGVAFAAMTSKLYVNKIHTPVREYISNACDAMRASRRKRPIRVAVVTIAGRYGESFFFCVEDAGNGLTQEEMEALFMGYFASKSRNRPTANGTFGLGAKSAFAYTQEFFVRSTQEGVSNHYRIFLNSKGYPEMVGVDRQAYPLPRYQDSKSGLQVCFEISRSDFPDFLRAMKQVASWATRPIEVGVVNKDRGSEFFNLVESVSSSLVNLGSCEHAEIFLGESDDQRFQDDRREGANLGIRVWMGDLSYPVQAKYLKVFLKKSVPMSLKHLKGLVDHGNIALRMPLGSVDLNASRESLEYTEKTHKAVADAVVVALTRYHEYVTDLLVRCLFGNPLSSSELEFLGRLDVAVLNAIVGKHPLSASRLLCSDQGLYMAPSWLRRVSRIVRSALRGDTPKGYGCLKFAPQICYSDDESVIEVPPLIRGENNLGGRYPGSLLSLPTAPSDESFLKIGAEIPITEAIDLGQFPAVVWHIDGSDPPENRSGTFELYEAFNRPGREADKYRIRSRHVFTPRDTVLIKPGQSKAVVEVLAQHRRPEWLKQKLVSGNLNIITVLDYDIFHRVLVAYGFPADVKFLTYEEVSKGFVYINPRDLIHGSFLDPRLLGQLNGVFVFTVRAGEGEQGFFEQALDLVSRSHMQFLRDLVQDDRTVLLSDRNKARGEFEVLHKASQLVPGARFSRHLLCIEQDYLLCGLLKHIPGRRYMGIEQDMPLAKDLTVFKLKVNAIANLFRQSIGEHIHGFIKSYGPLGRDKNMAANNIFSRLVKALGSRVMPSDLEPRVGHLASGAYFLREMNFRRQEKAASQHVHQFATMLWTDSVKRYREITGDTQFCLNAPDNLRIVDVPDVLIKEYREALSGNDNLDPVTQWMVSQHFSTIDPVAARVADLVGAGQQEDAISLVVKALEQREFIAKTAIEQFGDELL